MKTLSPQKTNRAITVIEVLLVLLVITIVVAMNLNFIIQEQSLIAAHLSIH